jgi:hypothetical protein
VPIQLFKMAVMALAQEMSTWMWRWTPETVERNGKGRTTSGWTQGGMTTGFEMMVPAIVATKVGVHVVIDMLQEVVVFAEKVPVRIEHDLQRRCEQAWLKDCQSMAIISPHPW